MGRFSFQSVKFCLLAYLVTITYADDNSRGPKRMKVSPYARITPFLRTGRSYYDMPYPEESKKDHEIRKLISRSPYTTFTPFPRVGRSGTLDWMPEEEWKNFQKRSGESSDASMNNGLWFGPRLGRLQKRQPNKQHFPISYVYLGDYTPRLGRESEEDMMAEPEMRLSNPENDKPTLDIE